MKGLKFWLGKILGSIVGFSISGFVGGFLGLFLGVILDKLHRDGGEIWLNKSAPSRVEDTDPNDFIVGSILLAGVIVKADGEVDDLELSYVRSFLVEQFGSKQMDDYWHILMASIKNDFDLKKTTQQIRRRTSYETRLQLIYFLFGIANADYTIDDNEIAAIKVISVYLGVELGEFESIKAMFYQAMDAYYKILEISPSAKDEDVKEACHFMLEKYHPNKLEHLGEGVKKAATTKSLKVQEAYDNIKKERGFR